MMDWSKAKIKAWSTPFSRVRVDEPKILSIERETPTFVWVTFRGRSCKLRKSELLDLHFGSVGLTRPVMEFKLVREAIIK